MLSDSSGGCGGTLRSHEPPLEETVLDLHTVLPPQLRLQLVRVVKVTTLLGGESERQQLVNLEELFLADMMAIGGGALVVVVGVAFVVDRILSVLGRLGLRRQLELPAVTLGARVDERGLLSRMKAAEEFVLAIGALDLGLEGDFSVGELRVHALVPGRLPRLQLEALSLRSRKCLLQKGEREGQKG